MASLSSSALKALLNDLPQLPRQHRNQAVVAPTPDRIELAQQHSASRRMGRGENICEVIELKFD